MSDRPGTPFPEENFEEENDLVELIDEEGNPTLFEHLATLEYKDESYLVLSEPESDMDEEELNVIIMKITQDENGEDLYIQPEPEEEEAVFNAFLEMLDEMEDGEE